MRLAGLVLSVAAITCPLRAGLVAFYDFDTNPGAGNTVINNANPGTFDATRNGATWTASGFQSGAFSFDGNDFLDALTLDINPIPMPNLTLGAWVKTSETNLRQTILTHDNGGYDRSVYIDNRGASPGTFGYAAFTGSGVFNSNVAAVADWVFVAARYSGSNLDLFVDGSKFSTAAANGSGLQSLRIGSNPCCGESFQGLIDNVFVYDSALTDDQIRDIRIGGANAILPSAVPEPGTFAMLGAALTGVGLLGRRRK
jgi:hypothetical protein